MIILDFLIYYLTLWFDRKKDSLSWSTPTQTACYAVGLMTMGLLYSINEWVEYDGAKSLQFHFPKLLYLVMALAVMKLYDYIYTTKNRYQLIAKTVPLRFNISDETGTMICIGLAFLTILSPMIVATMVIPFGGHVVTK